MASRWQNKKGRGIYSVVEVPLVFSPLKIYFLPTRVWPCVMFVVASQILHDSRILHMLNLTRTTDFHNLLD